MAAPQQEATGDQTATVTTEHSLTSTTTAGTYGLMVDLTNMVLGDVVVLRCKQAESASGTKREIWAQRFSHVNDNVAFSPPFPSIRDIEFTLEQEEGTSRVFPWSVYEYTG